MITDGKLIILLPRTPASLLPHDDLTKMKSDGSLRQYFGMISQVTLAEKVCHQINGHDNHHAIVVVERGFFTDKKGQQGFKKKLEESGVPSKHILFGEDYASGYHHILLTIHRLCE